MKIDLKKMLAAIGLTADDGELSDLLKGGDHTSESVDLVVPIAKVDHEKRLVFGIVYEPEVVDAHGEAMTAAEIEKSAHGFLQRYGTLTGDLGTDHTRTAKRNDIAIVESFISPVDFQLGDQLVKTGAWVMAAKVLSDSLWKDVKKGRFTGWSFEGFGKRVPVAA